MTLSHALATLETSGLLRLAQHEPELEYLFQHGLIQDAAYESLLKADRRVLHRAVAESLQRLYPDDSDDMAATLAYHFRGAELHEQALDCFARAAARACAVYANAEAITFYRAALEQAQHLPTGPTHTAHLHEQLGAVLELTGQHSEARAAHESALENSLAPLARARLHRKIGRTWSLQHRYTEATQAYDQAEQMLGANPTTPAERQEWLQLQMERMEMFYWRGRLPELAALVERVRPVIQHHGTPALRAHFYDSLISVAERRDRYVISDDILANARAMLAASHASGEARLIAAAHFQMGFVLLWHNDFDEAETQLHQAETLMRHMGDAVYLTHVLTYLSLLYRRQGQVERARTYTEQTLAAAQANGQTLSLARAEANLCWLAWREAQLAEAQRHGEVALGLWSRIAFADPFQWTAYLPLIAVALQHDHLAEAVRLARAMLAPTQHRLPEAIQQPFEQAVQMFEQAHGAAARACLQAAQLAAEQQRYL